VVVDAVVVVALLTTKQSKAKLLYDHLI